MPLRRKPHGPLPWFLLPSLCCARTPGAPCIQHGRSRPRRSSPAPLASPHPFPALPSYPQPVPWCRTPPRRSSRAPPPLSLSLSGSEMQPARFSDWGEPIDEEELEAVFRSASAASSARKRLRVIYADECDVGNPAVAQGEGADDSGSRLTCRRNGRHLPNWGSAADPSPPPSKMGFSCHSGSLDRGAGTDGRTGAASTSDLWRVLSPPSCRQVDLKVKLPLMSFGGRIVYGRTVSEVEKATWKLLEIIKSKKENLEKISMGLDIEWRPTFRRGEIPRKAAVMQICVDASHCFVLHIIHSGIPSTLKSVLEDSSYVKVGMAIAGDALKILKDYCVQVAPLDDLSSFANLKLGGTHKTWSLSSLTEMLTCKQLAKPKKIRLGNWEVNMLSRDQLHYAATDAFASWYLYEVLRSFPDAPPMVESGGSI